MLSERVTIIQRVWRGYKQRIYFKKLKKACVVIQKAWKKFSVRRKYLKVCINLLPWPMLLYLYCYTCGRKRCTTQVAGCCVLAEKYYCCAYTIPSRCFPDFLYGVCVLTLALHSLLDIDASWFHAPPSHLQNEEADTGLQANASTSLRIPGMT